MTTNEIKQIRLHRQHITDKTDKQTAVCDLCGLQAQFMVNVYYGLKIRCDEDITPDKFGDGLVKNWTVRGTVHAFSADDLPLFGNAELYRRNDFKGYGIYSKVAYDYCKSNGCPEEILAAPRLR